MLYTVITVYFYCQVVWKRLYSTCSGIDGRTLFQLRNLINRRIVVKDVKKDFNSCEEFMELIKSSHSFCCNDSGRSSRPSRIIKGDLV